MPRALQLVFACVIAAVLAGGPLCYRAQRERGRRNFRVVQDGVLYRSGQLDLAGLQRVVRTHGIKTVVCLREGDDVEDRAEEEWARRSFLNYVRIPPRPWHAADGTVPGAKGLEVFRRVMDEPANHPVLVHCYAGIHRTGTYVAVHRMDRQGWTHREAMNEMRAAGYDTLDGDEDVFTFLVRYRPRHGAPVPAAPASATGAAGP